MADAVVAPAADDELELWVELRNLVVVGWALWRVPGGNSAGATAMGLGAIAVAGAVAGWWGRRGTWW